jgi:hypothetical protein
LLAARVVRVEHGHARRRIDRAVEEQALGGKILLHRLVIVEMVAREVGEDGHVKVQIPVARPWSRAWLETSVTSSVAPRC